jgi:polysaccharide pyruvyl transferase WcaK-like protein
MSNFNPIRRRFGALLGAVLAAGAAPLAALAAPAAPRILLRSGWQIENIGDVAHTPGMLALLERHLPEAEVTFWPFYPDLPEYEVRMLQQRFPRLKIVQGALDAAGKASTPELEAAVSSADMMLHNSGPYALAWRDLDAFKARTGKPYGVFGVTYGHWVFGKEEKDTLHRAAFAYFRDSVSLAKARQDGVAAPVMGWTPDAAFALDVADDAAGAALLAALGLEAGKFLCCIPKHRYTPTWEHERKKRPFDGRLNNRNEEMKEHDHAPLREAIVAVVRNTSMKVLICNEDETETAIGKVWVLDQLPADVRARVVWLDRPWLLPEAVGVYKRSAGLFSNEMHSPIMCIAHGVPAIVNRWVEQSSKGRMWEDIGLPEWLFNFDDDKDVRRFPKAVLAMARQPAAARAKALAARARVRARLAQTMAVVAGTARA